MQPCNPDINVPSNEKESGMIAVTGRMQKRQQPPLDHQRSMPDLVSF